MTARVDYQPKASGATYASKSNTLEEDGWVWVPVTSGFIPAVAQAQYQTGDEEDEHIVVPLCVLAMLVDGAYEPSGLGLSTSDSLVYSHVIGATLTDAEDKDF